MRRTFARGSILLFLVGMLCFFSLDALAVPSFERQTGRSCNACHTVFPELTPFGRSFKLGGYIMTKEGNPTFPPLAATVQASVTEQRGVSNRIDPFDDSPNARWNLPQEASLFYGGKIVDHIGALAQLVYDGIENDVFLDHTDIRYANSLDLAKKRLIYGLTINNSPTVQDVWNTTPTWRFPWATSDVAIMPMAAPVIDDALARMVGGIGAYGFWNNMIYAEASIYRSNRKGITRPLGAGTTVSPVTNNTVPYWRLVLQHEWGKQSLSLGTYGIVADIYPGDATSGQTDRFIDTAIDAQYQYISNKHMLTAQGTFIHEKQERDASFALGNTQNRTDFLNTFRANVNYYYRSGVGPIGGTVAYFSTTGKKDQVLYAPDDVTGSRNGRPDSRGFILEADYLLKEKYKFSLQYTIYDKFNGARKNYDGSGRDASDNNTLYFVAWLAF